MIDWLYIDIIESIKPNVKNMQDNPDEALTFFSTKLPANAADIPKKNIAKEKANSIDETLQFINSAISSLSNDQQ